MIDWIKTAQGVATIAAAIFASMVLGGTSACRASCSRPSQPEAPGHHRIEIARAAQPGHPALGARWPGGAPNAAPPDLGFFGFNAILAASSLHRRWSVSGGAGHDRLHPSSRRGQDLQRFRYRLTSSWIHRCAAVHRNQMVPFEGIAHRATAAQRPKAPKQGQPQRHPASAARRSGVSARTSASRRCAHGSTAAIRLLSLCRADRPAPRRSDRP